MPDIRSSIEVEDKDGCRHVCGVRDDAEMSVDIRNYDFDAGTIEVRYLGNHVGYYKILQLADRLIPLVMEYRDKDLVEACRAIVDQWRVKA